MIVTYFSKENSSFFQLSLCIESFGIIHQLKFLQFCRKFLHSCCNFFQPRSNLFAAFAGEQTSYPQKLLLQCCFFLLQRCFFSLNLCFSLCYCRDGCLFFFFERFFLLCGGFFIFFLLCKRFLLTRGQLQFGFLQERVIGPGDALLLRSRFLLGFLFLLPQEVHDPAAQRAALRFQLAGGKFLRAGKVPVSVQRRFDFFLPFAEIRRAVGAVEPVIRKRLADGLRGVVPRHLIFFDARVDERLIFLTGQCFLLRRRAVRGFLAIALRIILRGSLLFAAQEFSQVCLRALRVLIQDLLKKFVSLTPLAVLQRHIAALEQRLHVAAALVMYHDGLLDRFFRSLLRLARVDHFFDATDQILHEADLAHIIALQHRQRLRQIIRVHIAVARQEQLAPIFFHHGQEAAPFVFDPDGVKMLRLRADHDHDFGRVQRREDIRLIFRARLIFQCDAREEHAIALLGQLVIDLLRHQAVACALAVLTGLLVAEEDVKRLLILRGGENAALHLGDFGCVLLILAAGDAVGMLDCGQIVHVLQEAIKARTVARRQPFICCRVLHIFDTEPAQRAAPVRLSVVVVLGNDALIHGQRLVKLAAAPEVIAAVKRRRPLLVVHFGQRHRAAAVFAHSKRLVRRDLNIPTTHFTLDDRHSFLPLSVLFGTPIKMI